MALPLSIDLRDRIAAALGDEATARQATKRFGVSVAWVVRVGQRRKSGLGQGHGKIGGYRRPKLKGETGPPVFLSPCSRSASQLTIVKMKVDIADT